jgi:hypothetical protein
MKILNLTQHTATPDQLEAGVFEPDAQTKAEIVRLLTFEYAPTRREMSDRAESLADIAMFFDYDFVMVGGAPFFTSTLERVLLAAHVYPVYAFSRRESVDEVQPDGSVRKIAVFKHVGFVVA